MDVNDLFRFNLGELTCHAVNVEMNTDVPAALMVVERCLHQCPAGTQVYYWCRLVSPGVMSTKTEQFSEMELMPYPRDRPKPLPTDSELIRKILDQFKKPT